MDLIDYSERSLECCAGKADFTRQQKFVSREHLAIVFSIK